MYISPSVSSQTRRACWRCLSHAAGRRQVCFELVWNHAGTFWDLNDEFCIKSDEFCIKNDEFCIKNDESCIKHDGIFLF